MRTNALGLAAALALGGCMGTLASGGGSTDDLGTAEQQLSLDATEAIQIAGILGYGLSGLLEGVPGIGGGSDAMPGPSGARPVGASDCTDVDWDARAITGVTVTFDECVLDNGEMLHGGVAVRLAGALGGEVTVELLDLAIGHRFITGTITLALSGTDVRIDADLVYLDEGTIMEIELTGVRMGIRAAGVVFDGEAVIVEDGARFRATLVGVTWSPGNLCHPSAGEVTLHRSGEPSRTLRFAPNGVTVQRGTDAPVTLPTAC